MQNKTQKAKVTCPICDFGFIPEAFHIEALIMDTRVDSSGTHIISETNVVNKIEIKPFNLIRKVWITNCPQCNYILRFTAEIAKKELNEIEGRKISSYDEFGTKYYYNLHDFPKPYMDYADYMNELILNIKEEILKALDEIDFEELGQLCFSFMTEKKIDAFKFLIRFYGILENYCNSIIADYKNKDMYHKIKECNFPQQLADSLEETRDIRNKIVHENYELTNEDLEHIKKTFLSYLYYRVSKKLMELSPINLIENIEYKFIDKKGVKWEIRRFLHTKMGEKLKFKDFYNEILIPLLDDLGIPQ